MSRRGTARSPARVETMSEPSRRALGLTILLLFVAILIWVAASNIGDAPIPDRDDHWRGFFVAALPVSALMAWYSWRKLTHPDFDTRLKFGSASGLLFPLLAASFLISRLVARSADALVIGMGVACGFFGGMLLVYGFDAATNRLSKGRSWRHGNRAFRNDGHSSNTSSPT